MSYSQMSLSVVPSSPPKRKSLLFDDVIAERVRAPACRLEEVRSVHVLEAMVYSQKSRRKGDGVRVLSFPPCTKSLPLDEARTCRVRAGGERPAESTDRSVQQSLVPGGTLGGSSWLLTNCQQRATKVATCRGIPCVMDVCLLRRADSSGCKSQVRARRPIRTRLGFS
eukprot:3342151-Rhodomonas_salina.1